MDEFPFDETESYDPRWGYVRKVYVRKTGMGINQYVVSVGSPYVRGSHSYQTGTAWRGWSRAMAEADYQAHLQRWQAAQKMMFGHSCDTCERGTKAERYGCPNNVPMEWLRTHAEPQPPEA